MTLDSSWSEFQRLIESGHDSRAIQAILANRWAIMPEALQQICAIAARLGDPSAIQARDGEPMDTETRIQVRDRVAIVSAKGPMFRYANIFSRLSGATAYSSLARDFQTVLESSDVDSILLDVDSPGGEANGMIELSDMILAARGTKPVVAYAGGTAASAAYGIAVAADEIVIHRTAMVGSIGVVSAYRGDGNDTTIEIVSSNAPKKRPDLKTDEGKAVVQKMVDDLEREFVNQVALARDVDRETVLSDFGQGGLLVGEEAVTAGMADRLGSLEEVIAGLAGNSNEVFAMPKPTATGDAPEITADYIAANYPAIAEKFRAEGAAGVDVEAERAKARQEECRRIQDVEAQSLPGHEQLIGELKFDGKTTGAEAAVQVLAAQRTQLDQRGAALQDLDNAPPASDQTTETTKPVNTEEGWRKEYEASADLQAEFGDVDAYIGYKSAESTGKFKTVGGS